MTTPRPRLLHRLPIGALALTLVLGACASLQQPVAPTAPETPVAWTTATVASTPTPLTRWWDRFGDPILSTQVERALRASTDIETAAARLRQARAQRDLSAAALAPTVSAGASAQASRSEGRPATEQYRIGVDASWEPDLWGGTSATVEAAEAAAQASAATLAATRLAVAAEAALNVLQWHGLLARLAIAQANLASQEQTLQIVQWRAQAGLVTQLDVEQARTAVEQTRAQIPALQTGVGQTLNALAVLAARAPGSLQRELASAEGAVQPEAPADLALAMPAEVLRQRPDVRAAERQLAAAAARVEAADTARLPSLNLGGSIGISALSLGALGPGAGVASLAASVNLPLLDGGRIRAQVRVQEAAQAEAAASYRATVLGALQDVEDTLVALRGTREQLASQRQAAAAARTAATLAEQRYRSGLVDFQNVLQTQRARLSADDGVATTLTSLNTLHVRLYKALGGGWTANDDPELAAR
jgi:NodT family efflux transporter outer membrane factor (OMF) lipoprotein